MERIPVLDRRSEYVMGSVTRPATVTKKKGKNWPYRYKKQSALLVLLQSW